MAPPSATEADGIHTGRSARVAARVKTGDDTKPGIHGGGNVYRAPATVESWTCHEMPMTCHEFRLLTSLLVVVWEG